LGPPNDWRRRIGRPRQSWLRTVEADLRPMNLGLATSKRRDQDRSAWRKLVTTATSTTSSWRRRIGLGSGFDYFCHCAICIAPNTESQRTTRKCKLHRAGENLWLSVRENVCNNSTQKVIFLDFEEKKRKT